MDCTELIGRMKYAGVSFADGLTESEFEVVEQNTNLNFHQI